MRGTTGAMNIYGWRKQIPVRQEAEVMARKSIESTNSIGTYKAFVLSRAATIPQFKSHECMKRTLFRSF